LIALPNACPGPDFLPAVHFRLNFRFTNSSLILIFLLSESENCIDCKVAYLFGYAPHRFVSKLQSIG